MKKIARIVILLLMAGVFLFVAPTPAYSYPVPPLPENNLIINPWFRSTSDPTTAGLDGWTNVIQDGIGWGVSQKASNPTSDIIVSGKCGFSEDYCGTAARWANDPDPGEQENFTHPGVDVYLYQVVNADPANRHLKYFMYWVNHRLDVAEVKIYGGDSADGLWTEVWLPFSLSQDKNPSPQNSPGRGDHPWFQTDILETTLGAGYPYYKIELHARYPEPNTRQGDVGVKITGVYFSTEFTDDPEKLSTPVIVYNPTVSAFAPGDTQSNPTQAPEATPQPEIEQGTTPRVRTPSPVPSLEQLPSRLQTPTAQISPTLSQSAPQSGEADGVEFGFLIGFISAGVLILVLFLIWRVVKQVRH